MRTTDADISAIKYEYTFDKTYFEERTSFNSRAVFNAVPDISEKSIGQRIFLICTEPVFKVSDFEPRTTSMGIFRLLISFSELLLLIACDTKPRTSISASVFFAAA